MAIRSGEHVYDEKGNAYRVTGRNSAKKVGDSSGAIYDKDSVTAWARKESSSNSSPSSSKVAESEKVVTGQALGNAITLQEYEGVNLQNTARNYENGKVTITDRYTGRLIGIFKEGGVYEKDGHLYTDPTKQIELSKGMIYHTVNEGSEYHKVEEIEKDGSRLENISNSKKALETPIEAKQEVSYIVTKGNDAAPIAMTEKEYADYEKTQNQIQSMVEKYKPAPTESVKSYYVTKEPLVKFEEKTANFVKDLIDFGIFPLANVESDITGKKASETISGRVAKTAIETPIIAAEELIVGSGVAIGSSAATKSIDPLNIYAKDLIGGVVYPYTEILAGNITPETVTLAAWGAVGAKSALKSRKATPLITEEKNIPSSKTVTKSKTNPWLEDSILEKNEAAIKKAQEQVILSDINNMKTYEFESKFNKETNKLIETAIIEEPRDISVVKGRAQQVGTAKTQYKVQRTVDMNSVKPKVEVTKQIIDRSPGDYGMLDKIRSTEVTEVNPNTGEFIKTTSEKGKPVDAQLIDMWEDPKKTPTILEKDVNIEKNGVRSKYHPDHPDYVVKNADLITEHAPVFDSFEKVTDIKKATTPEVKLLGDEPSLFKDARENSLKNGVRSKYHPDHPDYKPPTIVEIIDVPSKSKKAMPNNPQILTFEEVKSKKSSSIKPDGGSRHLLRNDGIIEIISEEKVKPKASTKNKKIIEEVPQILAEEKTKVKIIEEVSTKSRAPIFAFSILEKTNVKSAVKVTPKITEISKQKQKIIVKPVILELVEPTQKSVQLLEEKVTPKTTSKTEIKILEDVTTASKQKTQEITITDIFEQEPTTTNRKKRNDNTKHSKKKVSKSAKKWKFGLLDWF